MVFEFAENLIQPLFIVLKRMYCRLGWLEMLEEILSGGWSISIILGIIVLTLTAITVFTALFVLASLLIFNWKGKIIFPRIVLTLAGATESVVESILAFMGVGSEWLVKVLIRLRNTVGIRNFKKTEFTDRAIFVPQCIRHKDCPAASGYEGLHCVSCGRCSVAELKKDADKLGYKFFIAPGSSLVKRMTKKYSPHAAIGLGCLFEIKEFLELMSKMKVDAQGVLLETSGCVETTYSLEKMRRTMRQHA